MALNDIVLVRDKYENDAIEFESIELNLKAGSIIIGSEEDISGNVVPTLLESSTYTAGYVLALDSNLIPTWVPPAEGGGATTDVPGTDYTTFIFDYSNSTVTQKGNIIWNYGSKLFELKDNEAPSLNANLKIKALTLTGTTLVATSAAGSFASLSTTGAITASGAGTFNSTLVAYGNTTVAYNGGTFLSKASTFEHEGKLIEINTGTSIRNNDSTGIKAYYDGGYTSLTHEYVETMQEGVYYHSWLSSDNISIASGKSYYISNIPVLSSTTLGGGVTQSNLTRVGIIANGTWQGTKIATNYGGTGLNETNTSGNSLGDILCLNAKVTPYTYGFRTLVSSDSTISFNKAGTTEIGLTVNKSNVLDYKAKICETGVTEDYLFGKGNGSANDGLIVPFTGGGIGITKDGSQMRLSLKYDTLPEATYESIITTNTLALYRGGNDPFRYITAQNFFCSLTGMPNAPARDDAGVLGQIIVKDDYLYACTTGGAQGAAKWKRIILSTY